MMVHGAGEVKCRVGLCWVDGIRVKRTCMPLPLSFSLSLPISLSLPGCACACILAIH